jgi:hypothetical protein
MTHVNVLAKFFNLFHRTREWSRIGPDPNRHLVDNEGKPKYVDADGEPIDPYAADPNEDTSYYGPNGPGSDT